MGSDRAVQRELRRSAQACPQRLDHGDAATAQRPEGTAGVAHQRPELASRGEHRAGAVGDLFEGEPQRRGDGPGRPRGRLRDRFVGVGAEEPGHQAHARRAVHHAVVHLGEQGEAVALQALDDPHLPERAVAVEGLGEDARGQVLQLGLPTRAGKRRVADVVVEVEVVVVHPGGMSGERRERQLLPVPGQVVQARRDESRDAGDVEPAGRGAQGPDLEEAERRHVHVRGAALEHQERAVLCGEAAGEGLPGGAGTALVGRHRASG